MSSSKSSSFTSRTGFLLSPGIPKFDVEILDIEETIGLEISQINRRCYKTTINEETCAFHGG